MENPPSQVKFRSLQRDTELTVGYADGIAKILVSDQPQRLGGLTLNRVVVMPERALVNLIKVTSETTVSELPLINLMARKLLGEVHEECPAAASCAARIEEFESVIPEIGGRLVSRGVVCENAAPECVERCPLNLRPEL